MTVPGNRQWLRLFPEQMARRLMLDAFQEDRAVFPETILQFAAAHDLGDDFVFCSAVRVDTDNDLLRFDRTSIKKCDSCR